MPILTPEEQIMFQETILLEVLKPEILKQSNLAVFSLVSKIVKFHNTQQSCNAILKYFISLFDDKKFPRRIELAELVYLITLQYTNNPSKD